MKVQAAFRAAGRKTSEDTGERSKGKRKAAEATSDEPASKKQAANKKDGDGKGKLGKDGLPKIGQYESLGDYNRRIEALLRPKVSAAIKSAEHAKGQMVRDALDAKELRKAIAQGKMPAGSTVDDLKDAKSKVSGAKHKKDGAGDDEGEALKPNRPEVQFAEASQRRRVNDVVQAPPQLPKMRLAVKKDVGAGATGSAWGATGRTPLSAAQKRILDTERERVVGLYRDMKAKKEAEREAERSGKGKGKK